MVDSSNSTSQLDETDPRSYQIEIMERAKSENLIVCLPTGSGKTRIAIMLLKEWAHHLQQHLDQGGKRTVLLVKTTELAGQHYASIETHVDLKIKNFCVGSSIPLTNRQRWNIELNQHQILIFTAQKCLNLLDHGVFSLRQVNLLIIDECHHSTGDDSYSKIIRNHYHSPDANPRILGLTASISAQKIEPQELSRVARDLETLYQARIETGSDRDEITQHSTSVSVERLKCQNYQQEICSKERTVMPAFKMVQSFVTELDTFLKKHKVPVTLQNHLQHGIENLNNSRSNDCVFQCRTMDQLKSHLENIIHVGHDLGLYALSSAIKALREYLKGRESFLVISDSDGKALYEKILGSLDTLIAGQLTVLPTTEKLLYSDKVLKLQKRLQQADRDRCIIFVERVYTAAFLTQVLNHLLNNSIKIKYLAGSKVQIDGISQSSKYQRELMKEFRNKDIEVLISTAIIEEGLDVAECNLVIRFNKPPNFSSYMQSKGRARAKTHACFVILRDEPSLEQFTMSSEEYKDYEYMAKMLKSNFRATVDTDSSTADSSVSERFYQPNKRVKLDGTRAMQIINQYCGMLGQGQLLSPRFLYSETPSNLFQCVLTMPTNCPIRDDVTTVNRNKKRAKFECCLFMVEKLHKLGELDDACLPIRPDPDTTDDDDDDSNEEQSTTVPVEVIDKQTAYFMHETVPLPNDWYIYRIKISSNDELGFLVPGQLTQFPPFTLYGREGSFIVDIVYVKSINWTHYRNQLEQFNRYIFEQVFDNLDTRDNASLRFNIDQSTFKLLSCLLTRSDDIDWTRMATICDRPNRAIQDPSVLNENELYYPYYASPREYLTYVSDPSLSKKATDLWEHKKRVDTIKTYADYYEDKLEGIRIRRDLAMGTMTIARKPRLDYSKVSLVSTRKERIVLNQSERYYPIEVLRYASLNRADFDLIYKLPSVLLRLNQLYHAERLQQLFSESIRCYSLLDGRRPIPITFADCLKSLLSPTPSCLLPLACLKYSPTSGDRDAFQIPFDLLFQALSRRSASEAGDMENLEILGDCFLKLSMSMALYHQYPTESAGKLTMKKDRQVSNKNLYRLASEKDLKKFLHIDRVVFGGTHNNWIPPGYTLTTATAEKYTHQHAKRKAFADMIEALIGAFLVATDYATTRHMMQWLGLDVIPMDEQNRMAATPSILLSNRSDPSDQERTLISQLYSDKGFDRVEQKINYVFKNKAYLIAAFTHPSYVNNRLTHCYERLEYLGDAVLDFLVIRCIFVDHYQTVTPSHVTDIRQDLANNGRLAYLLGCCGLHKYILRASPDLFNQIALYTRDESIFPSKLTEKDRLRKDIDQWADSTAPKALADVFEALVGAIFLDSGYSLDTAWKVVYPLLQSYIEGSIVHTNINPIRCFVEKHGNTIETPKSVQGEFVCTVKTLDGEKFVGRGKNKRLARYDACRKAMKK